MELIVSDLFAVSNPFDFEKRLGDQEKLTQRIKEVNKDITDPKSLELLHVADEWAEFTNNCIASSTFREYILTKIEKLGVNVK